MEDNQWENFPDRFLKALESIGDTGPSGWDIFANILQICVIGAAVWAAVIGWKNLKTQQAALEESKNQNKLDRQHQDANLEHQREVLEENRAQDKANLEQRRRADDRSEWWTRTQWALEKWSADGAKRSSSGALILAALAESNMADLEDKKLLGIAWDEGTKKYEDDYVDEVEIRAGRRVASETQAAGAPSNDDPSGVDAQHQQGDNGPVEEEDSHGDAQLES